MEIADIEKRFSAEAFAAQWDEIMGAWDDGPEDRKTATRAWIDRKRAETIEVARECIDDETLLTAIATRYIELECNWVMLNTLMQFKLWTGKPNTEDAFRGTLVSTLIQALEETIDGEAIDKIKQFVGDPFGMQEAA
jgi:hypothetical protein